MSVAPLQSIDLRDAQVGGPVDGPSLTGRRGRRFRQVNTTTIVGATIVGLMLAAAIFAPLLAPFDPTFQSPKGLTPAGAPLAPGDGGFLLGTDQLGRDMLSRLLYGARVALFVAIVPNALAMLLAMVVGIPAGYAGGRVERVLVRVIETTMVLPAFLLALALLAVLGAGLHVVILALVLVTWSYPARVIYGETLRVRELAFVEAARAAGASHVRIMARHVMPQLRTLLIAYFALNAVAMVVAEASFSFLGFGIQPPTPSWGSMIADARQLFFWPWLILLPGAGLALVGAGFYLLGTGVQSMLSTEQTRVQAVTRRFLLRRTVGIATTLVTVATFTFLLTFVVPSDPARSVLGPRATPAQVEQAHATLGLDDPLPQQYVRYVGNLAQLDFGDSYIYKEHVSTILRERLPWTALLAGAALFIELVIGVPLGLVLAARAHGALDRAALTWTVVQVSLPTFWFGLVLLYFLAFKAPLFPLGGSGFPLPLVLPALALGLPGAAVCSRIMRDVSLDVMNSDFVRALRAKGMPPRTILFKHVLRSALSPVLTMIAMDFGVLMSGAVLVESVFAWPGLGSASYDAMANGDVPLLMASVLVLSLVVLVMNLLADIARAMLDPRIRLG